jgi:MFS family permease
MVLGRFVFGLGGESLTVAQSVVVQDWFKDYELNFALGLNISFARVGSIINGFLIPKELTDSDNDFVSTIMWGTYFCMLSFCCGIGVVIMDRIAEKQSGREALTSGEAPFRL